MAIVNHKPTPPPKKSYKPKTEQFKTSLINNNEINISSLIQYVEGSNWTVDFFHQNLGNDEVLKGYDPNIPDILQQYTLVKNMLLKVTSPLTNSNDPQGALKLNAEGSSIYFNKYLSPHKGDVFIAELLDGTSGLFEVTNVEVKTHIKDTVYVIDYKLKYFINSNEDEILKDIQQKIIEVLYYDKERLEDKSSPVLTAKDYFIKKSLKELYKDLINYYCTKMLDTQTQLFLIPGQDNKVFDPIIQNFMFKITDTENFYLLRDVNRVIPDDEYFIQDNIIKALLLKNIKMLDYCNRIYKPVSVKFLGNISVSRTLKYIGIDYVMFPIDKDLKSNILNTYIPDSEILKLAGNTINNNQQSTDGLFPDITAIDTYIFTENFYNDNDNLTLIEYLTLEYLKDNTLDENKIKLLADSCFSLDRVQSFYYIPILILLIRYYFKTLTSIY